MQQVAVRAEILFVIDVPDGRPHEDYAREAIQAAVRDCEIFLDGQECEPVKVFVDSVFVEFE